MGQLGEKKSIRFHLIFFGRKWIKEGKVFSKKIGEIGKGMTLQPSAALSNMYGQ